MKEYLPDIWENEEKISFLFEPPRSASVNPLDAEHKYKFWSEAIRKWCLTCRKTIFTLEEVKEAFRRKGRIPAYLPSTVVRMEREGALRRYEEAVREVEGGGSNSSMTVTSRLFSAVVVSPVKYGIATIRWAMGYETEAVEESTKFVAAEVVEEKSNEVSKILKARPGLTVYTITSFQNEHENVISDEDEALLILGHLIKKADVFIEQEGENFLVKVPVEKNNEPQTPVKQKPVQTITTIRSPVSAAAKPITEAEKSIAKISKTIGLLHDEISTICEDCRELKEKAVAALKQGNRDQAKVFLRKKKRLEQLADKRSTALTQLEILQESLVDADTDSVVLDAYKTAKDALKSTIKDQLHGVSGVEATLDDLNEVLQDHADISAALAEPVRPTEELVSMEELEAELKELMKEEIKLPSPPKEAPRAIPSEDELARRLEALRGDKADFGLPDVPTTKVASKNKEKAQM